jgi:hypothetical protein
MMGSILTAPFRFIAWLVQALFALTGRLLAVVVGLLLMTAGLVLTLTVIGAIIGIPLFIVGFSLTMKGIFG